ncbi:LOW QUALITY PROTEIN: hypothetical protein HID58_058407, partial [Brassica napus]
FVTSLISSAPCPPCASTWSLQYSGFNLYLLFVVIRTSLSAAETDLIQFSTGMAMGSLPVRYLGVPLCTKKTVIVKLTFTTDQEQVLLMEFKGTLVCWSTATH